MPCPAIKVRINGNGAFQPFTSFSFESNSIIPAVVISNNMEIVSAPVRAAFSVPFGPRAAYRRIDVLVSQKTTDRCPLEIQNYDK